MTQTIPLFPLNTVLFPDGPLKLRIFEARYVDMIGRCMREDSGFGVAMIIEGHEAGGPARTADLGTLARIVDFERLDNGLLGITARGEQRFRIANVERRSDGLNVAQVDWLQEQPVVAVPAMYAFLVEGLRQALAQLTAVYGNTEERYEDAGWVGARLAEILPLHPTDRLACLAFDDALERLEFLTTRLHAPEPES